MFERWNGSIPSLIAQIGRPGNSKIEGRAKKPVFWAPAPWPSATGRPQALRGRNPRQCFLLAVDFRLAEANLSAAREAGDGVETWWRNAGGRPPSFGRLLNRSETLSCAAPAVQAETVRRRWAEVGLGVSVAFGGGFAAGARV